MQVYHELQELEEEDKGREEVQEIERESQVEEERSDDHGHVHGVKDSKNLSHGACADDVTLCNRRDSARYAHVDVSGSGQWCTHRAVPRNHSRRHRRPRHHLGCDIYSFETDDPQQREQAESTCPIGLVPGAKIEAFSHSRQERRY